MEIRKPAKTYRDLIVWQKAMAAAKVVYEVTASFPNQETYGLTAQIRRSATSIPSNIAEGFGRRGAPEYVRFLLIARGSVFEIETQLQIACDVGFLCPEDHARLSELIDEVERMLESLIRSVRACVRSSSP